MTQTGIIDTINSTGYTVFVTVALGAFYFLDKEPSFCKLPATVTSARKSRKVAFCLGDAMYCRCCKQDKPESEFYPYIKSRCKQCKRDWENNYFKNNSAAREKKRQRAHEYNARPEIQNKNRDAYLGLKRTVMNAYGSICQCCGETQFEFLTIDHINGDGAKHRKEIGLPRESGGGGRFYTWLIKNNFPSGFQVLCYNCNCAKKTNVICPHQKGR